MNKIVDVANITTLSLILNIVYIFLFKLGMELVSWIVNIKFYPLK